MIKRILSLFLCFSVMLSMSTTCFAAANTSPWLDSANQTFEPLASQIILEDYARNMFPTAANAADLFQKWIVDTYGKTTIKNTDEIFTYKAHLKAPYGTVDFLPYKAYLPLSYTENITGKDYIGVENFRLSQPVALEFRISEHSSSLPSPIIGTVGDFNVSLGNRFNSSTPYVNLFSDRWKDRDWFFDTNFGMEYFRLYKPYLSFEGYYHDGAVDSNKLVIVYYCTRGSKGYYERSTTAVIAIKSSNYMDFMTLEEYNRVLSLNGDAPLEHGSPFGGGKAGRGVGAGRPDSKFRLQDPITKKVIDTDFVNETTNKITLANNTTYDMSGWTYDYSTRTYTATTVDNSTNITINYGDKNVTTNTVNNITGATETFNYNYVTVVEPPPPASSSTAPPPASSSTAPPPASSVVPPPASSGGGGSGGGSSGTDWLGTLLKSLLDGFLRLLNSVVGGVVDTIAGLVTKLVDGVTLIIDSLFKVMKQLLTFDSDFGKFLGSWFAWLPPEMVAILTGGLGLMVVLAVIRFMRKG